MTIKSIIPTIWVTDIAATCDFYRDTLAFRCLEQAEEHALLERDGVRLRLSLPYPAEPFDHPTFTGSFYFEPEDVDALWQQLKGKAEVVTELSDYANGMREFSIRDNNGYLLQFGVPIRKPEPFANFVIA
jgi:uncharacterized glyoxalase superfamily protein PhnB